MTPAQVAAAVQQFAREYADDWDWWLTVPDNRRPLVLGRILRRWQATRPLPLRRTRAEATHEPPYLDDLYEAAKPRVEALGGLRVTSVRTRSQAQEIRHVRPGTVKGVGVELLRSCPAE